MREDISCVFEGLAGSGAIYVSNIRAAQNPRILTQLKIKAIITAVKGAQVSHSKQIIEDHLYVPAYDCPAQNLSQFFDQTFDFIDEARKKTNVLVHCYAGISRSATIVIAYLLRKYSYSLEKILTIVKRRRLIVNPNSGFLEQLKAEAHRLGITCENEKTSLKQILLNIELSPHKKRSKSSFGIKSIHGSGQINQNDRTSQEQFDCNQNKNEKISLKINLMPLEQVKNQFSVDVKQEIHLTQRENQSKNEQNHLQNKKNENSFALGLSPVEVNEKQEQQKPNSQEKIEKFKEKVLKMQQKRQKRSISDFQFLKSGENSNQILSRYRCQTKNVKNVKMISKIKNN